MNAPSHSILLALVRLLAWFTKPLWQKSGLFWRMRFKQQLVPDLDEVRTTFSEITGSKKPDVLFPSREQDIVVIGAGPAAYHTVKNARQRGFTRITLIQDHADAIGGTCVNQGCMPSEFFTAATALTPAEMTQRFQNFRSRLRTSVQNELQSLCDTIIYQEAVSVEGKSVNLRDGRSIPFDVLVLATGQKGQTPDDYKDSLTLENFWGDLVGPLTVVIDHDLTGLSLASIAQKRGLAVRVVVLKAIPLGHLPSVKFFVETLRQQGICVDVATHVEKIDKQQITFMDAAGTRQTFHHSAYIFQGKKSFEGLPIDREPLKLNQIDFQWFKVKRRSDVFTVGDAAGFLSAAEAEVSAQALVDMWCEKLPAVNFFPPSLPLRVHATSSLAMVGDTLTYLKDDWQEVDFNYLGWTAVHQMNGKLWFQYNSGKAIVTAVHVCHPHASDLIGLATALMRFPVTDPLWSSAFTHPSSAEIFRLVRQKVFELSKAPPTLWAGARQLVLDRSDMLTLIRGNNSKLASVSPSEIKVGILDQDPLEYFAVLMGLKELQKSKTDTLESLSFAAIPVALRRTLAGNLIHPADEKGLSYEFSSAANLAKVNWQGQSIVVRII